MYDSRSSTPPPPPSPSFSELALNFPPLSPPPRRFRRMSSRPMTMVEPLPPVPPIPEPFRASQSPILSTPPPPSPRRSRAIAPPPLILLKQEQLSQKLKEMPSPQRSSDFSDENASLNVDPRQVQTEPRRQKRSSSHRRSASIAVSLSVTGPSSSPRGSPPSLQFGKLEQIQLPPPEPGLRLRPTIISVPPSPLALPSPIPISAVIAASQSYTPSTPYSPTTPSDSKSKRRSKAKLGDYFSIRRILSLNSLASGKDVTQR
ncbi:hypothetical protein SISNIDRAFT_449208, partial [Sistotremastrum niveocremeum HHB9708]